MIFVKKKITTFKNICWQIACLLLLLLTSCSLEVSGETNGTNHTHSETRLRFDPHELTIERNYEGSFNLSLSSTLNESISFTLVQDEGSVVVLPVENVTLHQSGNLTLMAVGPGRTVVSAQSPFKPYDYINVTDAYVVVNVFYSQVINVVSDVVGWTYFVFWTVAFYPQIVVNYQRKSVVGLDFNFLALNFLGHTSYDIFNIGLFWIPTIKAEYKTRNPRGVIPVRINDVGFSMHAVFATALTVMQCFIYERGTQTVSYTCIGMLVGMILFLLISLVLAIVNVITWLDYLYYFSYIKLAITLFKNCPQVYYNYRRKSTSGFSIWTVLCDFAGGLLSMVQMFLLAYNFNDWGSIFGDLSKFGLGLISVAFDIIYMIQHYIVYRKPYSTKRESLILPHSNSDTKRKSYSNSFAMPN